MWVEPLHRFQANQSQLALVVTSRMLTSLIWVLALKNSERLVDPLTKSNGGPKTLSSPTSVQEAFVYGGT